MRVLQNETHSVSGAGYVTETLEAIASFFCLQNNARDVIESFDQLGIDISSTVHTILSPSELPLPEENA